MRGKMVNLTKRIVSPMGLCIVALVCGIAVLTQAIVAYAASGYYTSDALESTFHAIEMLKAGEFFPKSWMATRFAHLQAIPLRVVLEVSSSPVIANRVCGLFVFACSLIVLYAFGRSGGKNGSWIPASLFYIAAPSHVAMSQLFTGIYYAQFAIGSVLLLTVWIATFRDGRCSYRIRLPFALVAVAVNFVCCALLGSRIVAVAILPIVLAIGALAFFDSDKCCREKLTCAIVLLAAFVACWLGCKAYQVVVMRAFGVADYVSATEDLLRFVTDGDAVISNARQIFKGLLVVMGFPHGYGMVSKDGLLGMAGFGLYVCLVIVFPILETCAWRRLPVQSRFLVAAAWLSVAGTLFILLFGRLECGDEVGMCSRYLLLPGILLLVVGSRHAYRMFFSSTDARMRVMAYGLLSLALATLFNTYDAYVAHPPDCRSRWAAVTDRLAAENLHYGYATYENSLLPTFYSEGNVCIRHVILDENRLSIPGFCVAERWYEPTSHAGPTFLMLTDEELSVYAPEGTGRTLLGEPRRMLSIGNYKVLVYDYNISQDLFGVECGSTKFLWGFQGQWVRNGYAKMDLIVPDVLRGKDAELVLKVQTFGERVEVFSGEESIGHFQFPPSDSDWTEKSIRLFVPQRHLQGPRLKLTIMATGMKSPREHGWHKDTTMLGPHVLSAKLSEHTGR